MRILSALFALLITFTSSSAFSTDLRSPRNRSSGGKQCEQVNVAGVMTDVLCLTGTGFVDPVGGFGTTTDGAASATASGLITTGSQTIAGAKTFSTPIAGSSLATATTTTQGAVTLKAPTQQIFTSGSGTYTTPAGVVWLRIRMVGGGGGGGGAGTSDTGGSGVSGGSTTFGSSFLTASGGGGGNGASITDGVFRGVGGPATIGSGAIGIAFTGGQGGNYGLSQAVGVIYPGGQGGSSAFGGNGGSGYSNGSGGGAAVNSGGGGGGAGTNASSSSNGYSGAGGGAGGFIDAIVSSPLSTYAYAVGTAGTGGTAGTSGNGGGSGAAGIIIVEEHYY